jgi:hypothetical protein
MFEEREIGSFTQGISIGSGRVTFRVEVCRVDVGRTAGSNLRKQKRGIVAQPRRQLALRPEDSSPFSHDGSPLVPRQCATVRPLAAG